jgi:hypothetical protein
LCQIIGQRTDINVTVEPASQTSGRVVALNGALGIDGWLTTGPWPSMAEAGRQAKGLPRMFTTTSPPVLARTPVVLAVWPDRAAALRQNCPNQQIGWKCLGSVAGKRQWKDVPGGNPIWGPVKIALPDPGNDAAGVTVLGAAAVDYFGRPDVAAADFEDDAFRDWVSGLKSTTPTREPTFSEVLATGKSLEDVYAGLEADVQPALAQYARADKPVLLYPAPMTTVDLVLAVLPGRAGQRVRDLVASAVKDHLADLGWRVTGGPDRQPALPALGAGGGVPDPGVLDALRLVWKEAA